MGPTDPNRLAHPASPTSSHGTTAPGLVPSDPGDSEPNFSAPLTGDAGDGPLANWEAAWIDFGGEG
jgi:hypothetical protein